MQNRDIIKYSVIYIEEMYQTSASWLCSSEGSVAYNISLSSLIHNQDAATSDVQDNIMWEIANDSSMIFSKYFVKHQVEFAIEFYKWRWITVEP